MTSTASSRPRTALVLGDSGWQSHTSDVSAYAGSTVRLAYVETVPETFTGKPAIAPISSWGTACPAPMIM